MDFDDKLINSDYDTLDFVESSSQNYDINSYCDIYNDDFDSTTDSMSAFSKKRFIKNKELSDKGFFQLIRTIKGIRVKIPCYSTRCVRGTNIRSATTGLYYTGCYVSKYDEDLFFKVRDTSGELGLKPYGNDFYYDSPEQYEKHLYTTIPQSIKDKWLEKYTIAKKRKIQQQSEIRKKYTLVK